MHCLIFSAIPTVVEVAPPFLPVVENLGRPRPLIQISNSSLCNNEHYLHIVNGIITCRLVSAHLRRLYRSVACRLFLAASKLADMDVNKCAKVL